MVISIAYFSSIRRLVKLQKDCNPGGSSDYKPLKKTTLFVHTLFFTYLSLTITFLLGSMFQGFYDWRDFLAQVLTKIFYTVMKTQLFLILAYFELDLSLKTQVLTNG